MKLTNRLRQYINNAKLTDFRHLASLSLTSENSLRVTLSRLAASGEIYNPIRGVYISKGADMFWVACRLYPGYISLSTALYIHHLTEEFPFTIFVASEVRKSVEMGNIEFAYFKAKDYLGVEKGAYDVASVEKTVCDSLRHGALVNFQTLAKALYFADIKADVVLDLSENEDSAFFQRLGYLLSILPRLDKEKRKLLMECKKRVKANAYLCGRSKGVYIPKWKIIDNIGKEVLLSWWLQ
ncbi:MAG: hypothetical protein M1158_01605 [Candidatus Marsarchaeota archaeon]|nr:hypothetical protein [Candidatus Marsarchaeota archaeon]